MSILDILPTSKRFASKNNTPDNINVVRVEYSANLLKVISINGQMLTISESNNFDNINNLPEGIYTISLNEIKAIEKALKTDKGADISKHIKKIEADFPDYKSIVLLSDILLESTSKNHSSTCFVMPRKR